MRNYNLFILLVATLTEQIAFSQGTTYISNLSQEPAGTNAVASDSWLASAFLTGSNANGYLLNSVQLGLATPTGTPNGFAVMIYSESSFAGAPLPGSSLETLIGPVNPATGGVYTYSDDLNLTLSPGTTYFLVVTASTPDATGAYGLDFSSSPGYSTSGNWSGFVAFGSPNGSSFSWTRLGTGPYYELSSFSLNATPIPEPSAWTLILLGGGVLVYARRVFRRTNTRSQLKTTPLTLRSSVAK